MLANTHYWYQLWTKNTKECFNFNNILSSILYKKNATLSSLLEETLNHGYVFWLYIYSVSYLNTCIQMNTYINTNITDSC